MRKTLMILPALLAAACGAEPQAPVASQQSAVKDFLTIYPYNNDTWFKPALLGGQEDFGGSCALRVTTPSSLIPGTALMRFPMSNVDCGYIRGNADSAALVLTSSSLDNGPVTVDIYEVTSNWSSGTTGLSGCTECSVSTNISAGAAFVAPSKGATPRASFTVDTACKTYKVDLTALVTDWCDNPMAHPNYGVLLRVSGGGIVAPKSVVFHSSEAPAAVRPYLWVGHPDADGDGI